MLLLLLFFFCKASIVHSNIHAAIHKWINQKIKTFIKSYLVHFNSESCEQLEFLEQHPSPTTRINIQILLDSYTRAFRCNHRNIVLLLSMYIKSNLM